MSVTLADLPTAAVIAWVRLRDELRLILDEDLVALWGYGARVFPDPPRRLGDVDTWAILGRAPDPRVARRIRDARDAVSRRVGVDLDVGWVLSRDASRATLPRDVVRGWRIDTWALHRAHWLAGRYVMLHGRRPEDVLRVPTWRELERAFALELAHLERHVAAGDDDPYEASYAMLNGARIVQSLATRKVVLSKRAAARWALAHLPRPWHAALSAAVRAYDGEASAGDREVLRSAMGPFVAEVRERLTRAQGDGRDDRRAPRKRAGNSSGARDG